MAKNSKKTKAQKVKKPQNYLTVIMKVQIGVIVAGTIILLAMLHLVSASEIKSDILESRLSMLSSSAEALAQHSVDSVQGQLDKLTHDDDIYNALALQDMLEISALESRFAKNFPQVTSLKIIPWGELGTAGMKQLGIQLRNNTETMLVAKAASKDPSRPEVYEIEKEWFISFAAPVVHEEKSIGVLLLSMPSDFLKKSLSQTVFHDNGGLQLSLHRKKIFTVGQVNSAFKTTVKAPFNGGTMQIALDNQQAEKLDTAFILIYAVVGIICLLFTATPIIGFILSRQAIQHDTDAIRQYIRQSMGLHEGKRPTLKIAAFGPLIDSVTDCLNHTAQTAPSGNSKAAASTVSADFVEPEIIQEASVEFSAPQIFKDYDIRGLVSTELTEENVIAIGKAIGSEVLNQGGDKVVIGFDARSSSDALAAQLSAGIHSTGCDTISIGQALSPTLYFATHKLSGGNGVMITGSHLSDSHNGFKVLINKQTLLGEQLQNLLARIQGNDFKYGAGKSANASVDSDYTQEIAGDIITARGLKIVVDNHNEIAATLVSQLLHENDCDIINVTSDNSNQAELISDAVVEHQADFGIAFDSDADRLMVTSSSGSSIDSDKLIMLFAQDISSRNPGSSIVYDVKCSRELGNVITQAGSRPVMHKAGHSNIKAKVFELDAVFAGEFTGHFYFNDRWYGFDDAIYAAMRLAELISSANESLDERLQTLPQTSTSPEYIIETSSDEKKHEIVSYVENAMESQQGEKITIDGFRIEFEAGWGLVRASNTSQAITLRFEAQNDELLKKLQALFKAGLRKADPTLVIPF